jgi:glycosyltransferase involved in cell wall biosynthesis
MASNWGTQFSAKTRWIHVFASWLTVGVIAHTAAALKPVSATWRRNCFIPHTVDIRSLQPGPGSDGTPVRILMVASFTETKGHDLLMNAVILLVNRGITNFKFRFVGTHDPGWLISIIEKEGLSAYFDFLGVMKGEALFDEFRYSDAFVLSSRGDTFGVVVHEAAAFGMPLLISKYAGASSVLVEEGKNGFVIDPYDATQFSDRLETLIQRPDLRKAFGKRSRVLAEKFSAHELGGTLVDWCRRLITLRKNG